jgi:phosphate transport system protein
MNIERRDHILGCFTGPLQKLKDNLMMMAGLTDRNFTLAVNAYIERDDSKADLVESEDAVIDRLEMEMDEMVIAFVSTRAPVATAVRAAFAVSKISEWLENIADQAVGIARRSRELSRLPEVPARFDLTKMAHVVLEMMRDAISAFVEGNPERALAVKYRDKEVDMLCKAHEETVRQMLREQPEAVEVLMHRLLISRSIERAGDYAKNIAEDVVFLFTAQDVRHTSNVTLDPKRE